MTHGNRSAAQSCQPATAADVLDREQRITLQLERLRQTVHWACDRVPWYRQHWTAAGISPEDIRTLTDLARVPFITKDDLRDAYPTGLFAVPLDQIVRLHASSGTTGKQVLVPYTQSDLAVWTECMVRVLTWFGIHSGDVLQNAYGYGLFTGGLGFHYGAEALGATVIPMSGGNTDRQIVVMQDFGTTAVCCTPSFFLHIADRAGELGVDLRTLRLRVGVFGAEPWSEEMRQRIQQAAGIEAFDIYGLAEIVGPGVAAECAAHQGLHVLEDHFYPEVIDPCTGLVVPEGEPGELVLTTLSKQALPMVRYRTGDITAICPGPCPCGRTLRRIRRVSHRSDDCSSSKGLMCSRPRSRRRCWRSREHCRTTRSCSVNRRTRTASRCRSRSRRTCSATGSACWRNCRADCPGRFARR